MDNELYKRFKEIRIKHGYKSQQALADALGMNLNNVKGWEKERKPVLPQLDSLLALCNLYDCDLDYLTGRIKEKTHDAHFIHEYTGLSEEAIKKVRWPAIGLGSDPLRRVNGEKLSHLIESEGFEDFIQSYGLFLSYLNTLTASDLDGNRPMFEAKDGKVILDAAQAIKHFKQEAIAAIDRICEENYNKKISDLTSTQQKPKKAPRNKAKEGNNDGND